MRYSPESGHGANAGLAIARKRLESIKAKHPHASVSDIWSLAGVVAVQEMGGPTVPWRAGRSDAADGKACTPDGRLPDASKDQKHLRAIFGRMGFNDREIVALSGAHALGRCHTDRSGFQGPWTRAPTTMSNEYFRLLAREPWTPKKWAGPRQFENTEGDLMMLPSDMALIADAAFKKHVEAYATDGDAFFADFSKAFATLLELGVPFPEGAPTLRFPRSS